MSSRNRGELQIGRRCNRRPTSERRLRRRSSVPRFARNDRRAFTLIELLVVIAIIATLASVVGPSIFGSVGDARANAAKSQIQIFALALDAFRLDNDAYPSSDQGLASLRALPIAGEPARNWRGPYLKQAVPLDPWGRPYLYVAPGLVNGDSYDLYTLGKDGRPGGTGEDADITSWNGSTTAVGQR